MNKTELENIVRCGETSTVQFKEMWSTQKKIAAEITAFANSKGGMLIFGIGDKTGSIIGLDYEELQKVSLEVGNTANEMVKPVIFIQTETVSISSEKAVLIVYVEEGHNKPYKDLDGNIWVKQGADKLRINDNSEILRLFHNSMNYYPDEEPVAGTTIDDIDMYQLNDYLRKAYDKTADEFGISRPQLLRNLKLLSDNGSLTLTGLLFFGKNPQYFRPSFMLKAVSFYGNDIGSVNYRDSKDFTGTIPHLFEQGMMFLKASLHGLQDGQSFNSVGHLEVPEVALSEILQNALVHREYIKQAPVRVLIFDNRVEIVSPGCLPNGMTVDDILFGNTCQRNPLIALWCAKTMDYRGLGSGINRARKEGAQMSFENSESGNQFKVIFRRPDCDMMAGTFAGETPASDFFTSPSRHRFTEILEKFPERDRLAVERVLMLCSTARPLLTLQDAAGYVSRTSFRRRILTPLLTLGVIEPMLKDSPNSPKQTYKIAE